MVPRKAAEQKLGRQQHFVQLHHLRIDHLRIEFRQHFRRKLYCQQIRRQCLEPLGLG